MIVVPDAALSPYPLAGYADKIRAALPAIETGLGGEVEWEYFALSSAVEALAIARAVYGIKRLRVPRRARRAAVRPQMTLSLED